ncbi:hypothetical protein vBCbaSRXM_53 [Citromicrobium phage vB_CbaS-RXM]|nr:hypothetical protein vBCbaSRXM_53 [Citromicrobium phage vB_CbaS-RXM]
MRWGFWLSGIGTGLWLASITPASLDHIWLLAAAVVFVITGLWRIGEAHNRMRKPS